MKILIVSGFLPYPDFFGGAIDVWERLKGLVQLGHQVDLIATDRQQPTKQHLETIQHWVRNFYFVQRQNKAHYILNKMPLQLISRKALETVEVNQSYDFIILESEFCWTVTKNKTIAYKQLIVRVHNDEHFYFKMLGNSSKSLKEKMYYQIEASKIKRLSQQVFEQANRLWFISKDDLKGSDFKSKSVFLPFPINQNFIIPKEKPEKNVVFMGALFMPNNVYGLDWYLEKVHPRLIEQIPDYHFYIVGSLKEKNSALEKKYNKIARVSLIINAELLEKYYQKSQVFINPMFHGSGVKVKSVNALVNGLPLVSTSVGAEGIGLTKEMYYPAQTAADFIQQITAVFNDKDAAIEKTLKAQEYLKRNNYLDVLKKELDAFQ